MNPEVRKWLEIPSIEKSKSEDVKKPSPIDFHPKLEEVKREEVKWDASESEEYSQNFTTEEEKIESEYTVGSDSSSYQS